MDTLLPLCMYNNVFSTSSSKNIIVNSFVSKIPASWFMACIIFTAPAPRHGEFFCKPSQNVVNVLGNHTTDWEHMIKINKTDWIRITHPFKEEVADKEFNIDYCNVYADAEDHAKIYFHNHTHIHPWDMPKRNSNIIPCDTFLHHSKYKSIITDYDLVCSRDILVATTQFFHLFGVLTGGLLAVNLLKLYVSLMCLDLVSKFLFYLKCEPKKSDALRNAVSNILRQFNRPG